MKTWKIMEKNKKGNFFSVNLDLKRLYNLSADCFQFFPFSEYVTELPPFHWNIFQLITLDRIISGAKYSGVPHNVHVLPLTLFAKPKSVTYKKTYVKIYLASISNIV